MKKLIFGLLFLLGGSSIFAVSFAFGPIQELNTPFIYTIDFFNTDSNNTQQKSFVSGIIVKKQDNNVTTFSTDKPGTILAQYVDPRSDKFSGFGGGSCTEYIARQRPELFINDDGSRRMTGNAEDRLRNAQRLGYDIGKDPKEGAIAVYNEGQGARKYGHVAYVEHIQENGNIIVSEMNYKQEYVVTWRVIKANLAAGYIY